MNQYPYFSAELLRMTKTALRKLYQQKRSELTYDETEEYSLAIANILTSSFDFSAKTVSVFLPIKTKKEIDTWPIIQQLRSMDAIIGLPVADFATNSVIHLVYSEETAIETNKFGIPEPTEGKLIAPSDFDYVLVPLLAIDNNGQRVGYGKGFYDQFLASCSNKCTFIGLHFFDECVTIDDLNVGDVPMHFCVNPKRKISFEK